MAALSDAGMTHYLTMLRDSPTIDGGRVMAPGDREWEEADHRRRDGIPLDPATQTAFDRIAGDTGITLQEFRP